MTIDRDAVDVTMSSNRDSDTCRRAGMKISQAVARLNDARRGKWAHLPASTKQSTAERHVL